MVECTGLENQRTERYRGFESLLLRKTIVLVLKRGLFYCLVQCIKQLYRYFDSVQTQSIQRMSLHR